MKSNIMIKWNISLMDPEARIWRIITMNTKQTSSGLLIRTSKGPELGFKSSFVQKHIVITDNPHEKSNPSSHFSCPGLPQLVSTLTSSSMFFVAFETIIPFIFMERPNEKIHRRLQTDSLSTNSWHITIVFCHFQLYIYIIILYTISMMYNFLWYSVSWSFFVLWSRYT